MDSAQVAGEASGGAEGAPRRRAGRACRRNSSSVETALRWLVSEQHHTAPVVLQCVVDKSMHCLAQNLTALITYAGDKPVTVKYAEYDWTINAKK